MKKKKMLEAGPTAKESSASPVSDKRRKILKVLAGLPLMAGFAGTFIKNITALVTDTYSGKSELGRRDDNVTSQKGELPMGKLGNLEITRLIMGCNLISGYAHARDLIYANTLFKTYHTEQKIFETFRLAEKAGINTTFITNPNFPVFHKYLKEYGGKIQTINQTYLKPEDFLGDIDKAIDNGAKALYIQGGEADRLVKGGKISQLASAIEYIKKKGYLAGIGAHSLEVIKAAEKEAIPADYYVKTFHHDKYWSAHPESEREEFSVDSRRSLDHNKINDNMFDLFSVKTMEYMNQISKPWIAFKVLAAGAIRPADGFNFAFENGADFICVGMFDFQIVDDVKIANEVLSGLKNRKRAWYS
jgi:hypothetical protein